ncbi:hypothetical protein VNO77_03790 [Canavalia gladiata]|uniref:Uncharacterized protein n=1 Tax=Canavalia gladiata TaxID=3824 RepID=A0AAN9RCK1_CANGL
MSWSECDGKTLKGYLKFGNNKIQRKRSYNHPVRKCNERCSPIWLMEEVQKCLPRYAIICESKSGECEVRALAKSDATVDVLEPCILALLNRVPESQGMTRQAVLLLSFCCSHPFEMLVVTQPNTKIGNKTCLAHKYILLRKKSGKAPGHVLYEAISRIRLYHNQQSFLACTMGVEKEAHLGG